MPQDVKILVLAGRRSSSLDSLAEKMGVTHKAMVPVAGEAMIGRVLRIADEAFPEAPLFVSVEDFAVIASEPTVARLHAAGRLTAIKAQHHIVDSVVEPSHAIGYLASHPEHFADQTVLVILSGRGDKDLHSYLKATGVETTALS